MENGVKITDPDRIRTEVERAYQVTMELEKRFPKSVRMKKSMLPI